eukprot:2549157-Rhodomonas_salina.1
MKLHFGLEDQCMILSMHISLEIEKAWGCVCDYLYETEEELAALEQILYPVYEAPVDTRGRCAHERKRLETSKASKASKASTTPHQ